jgi:hypothetical protein
MTHILGLVISQRIIIRPLNKLPKKSLKASRPLIDLYSPRRKHSNYLETTLSKSL